MSAPDFGKPFADLTPDEMAELEAFDWTAEQIITAIKLALEEREMEAVADLLARLARKDPRKAALIVDFIGELA